jgi:signal peptidase II
MLKRHLLIALAVFVLDRGTKWAIVQTIALEDAVPIIPGFFRLTYLENTGAAFSLFADSTSPFRTALLVAFSVAALTVVALLMWRDRNVFNSATLALSLILGGAVGNLWDRLADGKVTDFLDFYVGAHHWPPFNVADSAIVVGAMLLLWRMLHKEKRAADTAPKAKS